MEGHPRKQAGENVSLRGYAATLEPWLCPDGRANPRSGCRGQRGIHRSVGGARNYLFRVGQHIVCIDGWLPPPPIQTAGRGQSPSEPKGEQKKG